MRRCGHLLVLITLSCVCLSFAYSELDIWIPQPFHADVPTDWWDLEADKSLLIGVFKHGKLRLLTADTLIGAFALTGDSNC